MELLFSYGAKLDAADTSGWTACHAAAMSNSVEVLDLLISKSANINVARAQQTPVHWAALGGHKEAMTLLLSHGANPNVVDGAGDSPWHWAAQNGRQEMLEMLMLMLKPYGINPNATNRSGKTPAMVAREQGHFAVADWMEGSEVRDAIADCVTKPTAKRAKL